MAFFCCANHGHYFGVLLFFIAFHIYFKIMRHLRLKRINCHRHSSSCQISWKICQLHVRGALNADAYELANVIDVFCRMT